MTVPLPTWHDLIGQSAALYAPVEGGILCRWCAGTAKLYVREEGEPVPCAACGDEIVSIADLEASLLSSPTTP